MWLFKSNKFWHLWITKCQLKSYFIALKSDFNCNQCDQIGRFIGLWATFQSLWQQLISPNLLQSKAFFIKVSKSLIFPMKSFLCNFLLVSLIAILITLYVERLKYDLAFPLKWKSLNECQLWTPSLKLMSCSSCCSEEGTAQSWSSLVEEDEDLCCCCWPKWW